jgi:hypothetical protein
MEPKPAGRDDDYAAYVTLAAALRDARPPQPRWRGVAAASAVVVAAVLTPTALLPSDLSVVGVAGMMLGPYVACVLAGERPWRWGLACSVVLWLTLGIAGAAGLPGANTVDRVSFSCCGGLYLLLTAVSVFAATVTQTAGEVVAEELGIGGRQRDRRRGFEVTPPPESSEQPLTK